VTVTIAIPSRQENQDPGFASSVNTPYHHYWISANKLSKGEHLLTAGGAVATADGGTTPADHDGWMWDLTVPGNGDHDFYVFPTADRNRRTYNEITSYTPVLVHNDSPSCANEGVNLYRGMRGTEDGSPDLGSSASKLGARPGVDIPVDENGMVQPETGGMSVNESPTGMPEFRRPPSFGGSGKGLNMYRISSCDLGDNLQYVPDSGGHGFLEPASEMSFEEYAQSLAETASSWIEVVP
jgi:hypothetical protein